MMENPGHFENLFEPGLLAEIRAKANRVRRKAGDTLIDAGQTVEFIPLILSGLVKVSRVESDGRELFLYHIKSRSSGICNRCD